MLRSILLPILLVLAAVVVAGPPVASFTENRGQWPQQVLYRAKVPGGALYVEREGLTFVFQAGLGHHHGPVDPTAANEEPRGHAYRVHFVGGQVQHHEGGLRQGHYENYFTGNDPAHWGTGCEVFGELLLKDIWPGIDMRLDGRHGLKYDLLVAPGADHAQARFRYEGQDGLFIREGKLLVVTSVTEVTEEEPVAFHGTAGTVAVIADPYIQVAYSLDGNVMGFSVQGNDPGQPLVIDPVLTFASYSGSTADNFGFTATYDVAGHLYGGGAAFGVGYPSTPGVFDPTFNGGNVDVAISKWSPDGASLIWSTYLGGSGSEVPHSLVVNQDQELFVMGSTGSSNYPTTPGCHNPTFQGGPNVTFATGYGFTYTNGTDLFLTHLNAAATGLIGSTYVGGTNTDGVNNGPLSYNYGDPFRGEIALDPDGNPVVATCTASNDAPTTPGAPQPTYGGGPFDAYIFRMDPGLTTMLWATFHGGSLSDVGHGVQFDSDGRVYVTGGTMSNNMPTAGTPYQAANSGGTDGYIARYSTNGNNLLSATYLGTANYDQCFFVQIDTNDDVYVVGQTRGNYPQSPGVYANPGSSQFIHKFNTDLSASIWSTRIGNGNGTQDLSPTAFLVSDCGQIYVSAWGGATNNNGTPTSSTTNGLPLTPDAFQSTTNGSDFYLMVLEPDAAGLSYATYFGGGNTSDHVDGGTSRFDKDGTVYQAVCAGCGGQNTFPTTPGAWSNTNNSFNCNLGVFKFDLNIPIASIDIAGPTTICFPDTVQFVNNSTGGNTYFWNFGDGSTSTDFAPTHIYTQAGVFNVSMVMTDVYGCAQADTASIVITSIPGPDASIEPVGPICPGGSVQLMASDGTQWEWFPPDGLSSTTVQDPIATPAAPTTYFVVVTSDCGVDTASVDILFADPQGTVLPDTAVCLGSGVMIGASGGVSYEWSPAATLSDPNIANPIASPLDTTTYTVLITTADGCQIEGTITVNVVLEPPTPVLADTSICAGASVQLTGPDAVTYVWQPANSLDAANLQSTVATPTAPTLYTVLASNLCGSIIDSVFVDLVTVVANAWPDTLICPGNPVMLSANGGSSYTWSPTAGLDDPNSPNPVATTETPVTYTVTVVDGNGCTDQASLTIGLLPPPTVYAGWDHIIDPGDQVLLTATGDGTFEWSPPNWLDCPTCAQTWAAPEETTTYTVTLTASNGCTATDRVTIIMSGTLFVPNTFTPNGDGVNDFFGAQGSEIATFTMYVFNRWGELIFTTNELSGRWDGTYMGRESPIDTYVWRIDATELSGRKRNLVGHVNLVR
jgi:gliding motility-associated-like protein